MPTSEQAEQRGSDGLLEAGFADLQTAELLGWPARVARMVEVEAALGVALARVGIIRKRPGRPSRGLRAIASHLPRRPAGNHVPDQGADNAWSLDPQPTDAPAEVSPFDSSFDSESSWTE